MGGHGGLNILPQKKWNVYGRENRLKVARDEEAFNEEQKKIKEKHEVAEREHRHRLLLERARQRHGGAASLCLDVDDNALPGTSEGPAMEYAPRIEEHAAMHHMIHAPDTDAMRALEGVAVAHGVCEQARQHAPGGPSSAHLGGSRSQALVPTSTASLIGKQHQEQHQQHAKKPKLEHVNLFAKEEAKAKNPERAQEQRHAAQRRGDPTTQTSDAKFDERFGFAHGITGKEAVPWYARHAGAHDFREQQNELNASRLAAQVAPHPQHRQEDGVVVSLEELKRRGQEALLGGVQMIEGRKGTKKRSSGKGADSSDSDGDDHTRGRKRRREGKKEKKQGKTEKKDADTWSVLREERLRREDAEKERQLEAVRRATGAEALPPGGRRFYNSYGYGSSRPANRR